MSVEEVCCFVLAYERSVGVLSACINDFHVTSKSSFTLSIFANKHIYLLRKHHSYMLAISYVELLFLKASDNVQKPIMLNSYRNVLRCCKTLGCNNSSLFCIPIV